MLVCMCLLRSAFNYTPDQFRFRLQVHQVLARNNIKCKHKRKTNLFSGIEMEKWLFELFKTQFNQSCHSGSVKPPMHISTEVLTRTELIDGCCSSGWIVPQRRNDKLTTPSTTNLCRACIRLLFTLQVSWIRHSDTHLLTAGLYTYMQDLRFSAIHRSNSEDWVLELRDTSVSDQGELCAISLLWPLILVGKKGISPDVILDIHE